MNAKAMLASPAAKLEPQHALITELQQSVRLDADELRTLPRPARRRFPLTRGTQPSPLPAIPIGASKSAEAADLGSVLERRESVRFYREQPVELETVASIVRAALHADASAWPDEARAGVGIDLLVAARRMAGASPGIYRLSGESFDPLAQLDNVDDMVLQIEYAWSPVIFIAIAPLALALDRWGDHGERLLNIRAGAAIANALHEAASLGLVGSPFAGFLTSGLRRLLDVDGYAHAQFFAASVGHPTNGSPAFIGSER